MVSEQIRKRLLYAAGALVHRSGAFRLLQRAALPDAVSIAMYHGITAEPLAVRDWCFTSAQSFRLHMEYLARHFQVMHVEDALAPERPRAPRPVACVTFDEGFRGVHDYAWPVLRRLGLPATVYLVTDLVDRETAVWSVRLHQAITETRADALVHEGKRYELGGPAARAHTSASLQEALKTVPAERFSEALEGILASLGFGAEHPLRPDRCYTILHAEEIRAMSQADLFRFGGHTATHQILTRTSAERGFVEIERSLCAVRALVARPSASFAYPNGTLGDFDDATIASLRRLGVRYGVTTIEGPNERGADPYRIRRYGIGAEDPVARFAGLMHHSRAAVEHALHTFARC